MAELTWMIVNADKKDIGAIGFLGNKAAAITAFFEDRDGNMDGELSPLEAYWPTLPGNKYNQVATVAMVANRNMKIAMKDNEFHKFAQDIFAAFGASALLDGVYAVYFNKGVGAAGGLVAKQITNSMVKQILFRKGMEEGVKMAMSKAGLK